MILRKKFLAIGIVLLLGFFSQAFAYDFIPESDLKKPFVIYFQTTRDPKNGALKKDLLHLIKVFFGVQVFVETGTYKGDTTFAAVEYFKEIHTIELMEEFWKEAKARFQKIPKVHVHKGDSGEVLKSLLPKISGRILFYLDGHFSGQGTAKGASVTPILEELKAIKKSKKRDSIILIDDVRCFQESLYPEKIKDTAAEGYPLIGEVIKAIFEINPAYQICFWGDDLLAFPKTSEVGISPLMRATGLHRLEFLYPISEADLEAADAIISKAKGEEYKELLVYYDTYASWEMEYGYRSFSALWYALTLNEAGRKEEALHLFQKIAQNSIPGWRVQRFFREEL